MSPYQACQSAYKQLAVRVWDTVGEDQTLKGEYKVISGRMYVVFFFTPLPFVIQHCCLQQ